MRPNSPASDPDPALVSPRGIHSIVGRIAELVALVLISYILFFMGTDRYDFIKTEALRAIVVSEMLDTDGYPMPTIHHRPYLKKPPLYAWTTTALARAVGLFDERVARFPSNVSAAAFILLLYVAGEWCVGRYGGLAAASLAVANVTVIDYGFRAELDMGFTFCTTLSMLLVWAVIRTRGVGAFLAWMGVYLAALVAAMYKGPHSLIFLWLLLLAYSYGKRQSRWLLHPGNVTGLTGTLAVLVAWTVSLSRYAGPGTVGKSAAIELLERLVPYRPAAWISIATFLPLLFLMLLPASLLVLASVFEGQTGASAGKSLAQSVRSLLPGSLRNADLRDYIRAVRTGAPTWWRAIAVDPFAEFLLYWLVPNILFMAIVPAKSSRYTLPIFAPAFLLAACVMRRYLLGRVNAETRQRIDYSWTSVFAVIGLGGLAAIALAVAVSLRPDIGGAALRLTPTSAWWIMGVVWLLIAAGGLLNILPRFPEGRWLALLLIPVAARPVFMEVWWPLREAGDSQIAVLTAIDEVVPAGEPVIVVGNQEMADLAFYSSHHYYWLNEPTEAAVMTKGDSAFVLIPTRAYGEWEGRYPGRLTKVRHFERKEQGLAVELVRFDLRGGGVGK